MFYAVTDYATSGQNVLRFTRYYNSRGTYYNVLGANWRSTFDRTISPGNSGSQMVATRSSGQILTFNLIGGVWKADSDVDVKLSYKGSTWTLIDRDDTKETYTGGSNPVLTSIEARNGYTQTLTYSAYGYLRTVTDSYGRKLSLTYGSNGLLQTMLTPDGTTISYGYTPSNSGLNLTSVTFPTVPATSVTYQYSDTTLLNALTGVVDENGQPFLSWTYDSFGRALTSQTGTGVNANLTTVSYNDATLAHTVTNALGVSDTYTFTILQDVPKIISISRAATANTAAATRSFTYDTNGYKASETDWNGNQTLYANDMDGQPLTIVEANGTSLARTTTIAYDALWVHLPATITTAGLTAAYTYDEGGEQLTKTLTDTTTGTAPYSTSGQTRTSTNTWSNALLASVQTPNGNTTSFGYDDSGALTSLTDALSHVTTITSHTGGGLPETVVDPNGVTTTFTYNPRQWLIGSTVSGTGGTFATSLNYDATGNLIKTTLPDGSYLANTYDAAHRLIQLTNALGENINLTLDALGNQAQSLIQTAAGTTTRKHGGTFDDLGRMSVDMGGAGQTTTLTYDPNGNPLTSTDALNHSTKSTYDALNRLSTTTDANGGVTTIGYDTHDRIISVKDANGHTTSYARNGFGDVIQQTSPDSGITVYRYDADANLTQKVDAAGIVTNRSYDALDRPLTTTYPADPVENVAFTYDESGHGFGIGRLTSMADRVGNLSRTYDERGNLLTERRGRGSVTYPTSYTYDGASRIASITYPSGSDVTYNRDAAGQVTKVASVSGTVASGITHLPFGPANAFTYGNGIADTRNFDLDYRMTGLVDAAGSAAYQSLVYAYDLANNLSSITDIARPYLTQTLGYDVLNRLTSASQPDYGSFAWTYDKLGNRLTESRGAASLFTSYTYGSGSNRLAGISTGGASSQPLSYTPTGNIAGAGNGTGIQIAAAVYNNDNRLQAVSGFGQYLQEDGYDGFGQRLAKILPGTTPTGTLFQYGQDGSLLEEADLTGTAKADYIYLDGVPIGDLAPSSSLYYLHTDRLGTPQGATDNFGTTVWEAAYYPFGGTSYLAGTITQNLRLSGMYFDSETQSYHNGFRDYAPSVGRYVETYPISLEGGLNSYPYTEQNTLPLFDKSELLPEPSISQPYQTPGDVIGSWFTPAGPQYHVLVGTTSLPASTLGGGNCFGFTLTGSKNLYVDASDVNAYLLALGYKPVNGFTTQPGDIITFSQNGAYQHIVRIPVDNSYDPVQASACNRCTESAMVNEKQNTGGDVVTIPMTQDQYGHNTPLGQRSGEQRTIWRYYP